VINSGNETTVIFMWGLPEMVKFKHDIRRAFRHFQQKNVCTYILWWTNFIDEETIRNSKNYFLQRKIHE